MNEASESNSGERRDEQDAARPFPVVGIGASAGGIKALQNFFQELPDAVDAAFVVILHLDPEHQSDLPSVLANQTRMPVIQVTGRTPLQSAHVYVIPPNRQLTLANHHLSVSAFVEPRWQRAPIDLFFRSLSEQKGNDFAIIFSGAGSDGASGIKSVKESGGLILVQEPDEADFSSMPRSAIATGLADFVLPVREIARRLPELIASRPRAPMDSPGPDDEETVQRILSYLRIRTGHDFTKYKKSTVRRRIARRMQVQRTPTLAEYLSALREQAEEAQALFADLLISVTTFFRDPAAFRKLAELVIPALFDEIGPSNALRVWAPACATGEEAYSIAMLLLEEAGRRDVHPEIQVFASDIDAMALATAREGRYPVAIETDLSDERLRRFFTRESDHYRVRRELRDVILFARHSILKDPPFSRLDLISCRNLLIYLDRELQQQVCATFHFALRPGGYLFLGSSESAESPLSAFRSIDRDARLYQRMPASVNGLRLAQTFAAVAPTPEPLPARGAAGFHPRNEDASHREALERLAPPSAVVDESYRVLHLSETAGRYLQPSAGALANDITMLAREELRSDLRTSLHRVFSGGEISLSAPIPVRFNGTQRRVYLQVRAIETEPSSGRAALVFFFEGDSLQDDAGKTGIEERRPDEQIRQLQQELQYTQSQLRTSREEYEGANEELRAANEELQSINEEYRSTTEELETSKEELQSINEELQTVNSELKTKLESVSRAHSDIQNLMVATDVGILFLDNQLRIKRFTPRVADLFNIATGDEGRSITDFTHSLDFDGLADDARDVLRTLSSSEREVRSKSGAWYLMRMRPYRTVENRIDGVVVTLVDFSERRRAEDALRGGEARIRAVIDGVDVAIVTVNDAGAIQSLNRATMKIFGYAEPDLVGRDIDVLAAQGQGIRKTIQTLLDVGEAESSSVAERLEGRRKNGSSFPAEATVSRTRHGGGRLFIVFIRDLSERRKLESRLERLHINRLSSMAEMATALAHEINQPLTAAATYLKVARRLLATHTADPQDVSSTVDKAAEQMLRAGEIIGHLREFVGPGEPDKTTQSLHALIRQACKLMLPDERSPAIELVLHLDAPQDAVLIDKVQVLQALVNVIRNAKDAMQGSAEQRLTITTALDGDQLRVAIADTGRGLPGPDLSADIFEPFTSSKPNSLGVGLPISKSIIQAHYGTIAVERNADGGATFIITLPLMRADTAE
ncbi:MAG: chemotaxis protein CheB [Methylocystis sp.]|uniref:chemotaxis protein CheB n=1 Tax=Methylocystis sp. TaxID=1911079 RepID=UPI003DA2AB99